MILELPKDWDSNEWFIVGVLLICSIIIFILPRRFPKSTTILILMLGLSISKTLDHIFGIPPYDFYDTNDQKKYEIIDIFLYLLYTPFGYFCLYLYDLLKMKRGVLWGYVAGFALFGVFFEWLTLKLHVFTYKGWKLVYSFPTYVISISLTLLFYHLIKWKYEKTKLETSKEW